MATSSKARNTAIHEPEGSNIENQLKGIEFFYHLTFQNDPNIK